MYHRITDHCSLVFPLRVGVVLKIVAWCSRAFNRPNAHYFDLSAIAGIDREVNVRMVGILKWSSTVRMDSSTRPKLSTRACCLRSIPTREIRIGKAYLPGILKADL